MISPKNIVFHSLKIDFVFANSADPDEMPHYAAFHLGIHCLSSTHLRVSGLHRVTQLFQYVR